MRLTVRRALTAATVVAIGAAGALAVALPAHAAALTVNGTASCDHDTGRWQVTWSVGAEDGSDGTVTAVTPGPGGSTVDGLATGDTIGAGPVTVTQSSPGDADTVTLTVAVDWTAPETISQSVTGEVDPAGTCVADPPPTASFTSHCDGSVTVTLTNDAAVASVEFEITADASFTATRTVAAGDSATVDVPAGAATHIDVHADQKSIRTGGWQDPGGCATSAPPTTTPPTTGGGGGGGDDPDDPGGTSTGTHDGGHPSTGTHTSRNGSRATASPTPTPTETDSGATDDPLAALGGPTDLPTQPAPVELAARHDDAGWGGTAVLVAWIVAGLAVLCLVLALLNGLRRKRGRRRYERYVSPFADFH
jgi:hypothetical protein